MSFPLIFHQFFIDFAETILSNLVRTHHGWDFILPLLILCRRGQMRRLFYIFLELFSIFKINPILLMLCNCNWSVSRFIILKVQLKQNFILHNHISGSELYTERSLFGKYFQNMYNILWLTDYFSFKTVIKELKHSWKMWRRMRVDKVVHSVF